MMSNFSFSDCKTFKCKLSIKGALTNFCVPELYCPRKRMNQFRYSHEQHNLILLDMHFPICFPNLFETPVYQDYETFPTLLLLRTSPTIDQALKSGENRNEIFLKILIEARGRRRVFGMNLSLILQEKTGVTTAFVVNITFLCLRDVAVISNTEQSPKKVKNTEYRHYQWPPPLTSLSTKCCKTS